MNINGFFDLPVNQQNLINMVNARDNLNHYKLTNDWLFGFIEAEAELRFKPRNIGIVIEQHVSDYFLMVAIQKFIGVGDLKLAKHKDGMVLRYTLYDKDKIENYRKLCHEFANKPSIECQAQITQLLKQQTINQEQM